MDLVHAYSSTNGVIPTGFLKHVNCPSDLCHFKQSVQFCSFSSPYSELVLSYSKLAIPVGKMISLCVVCSPTSLASHMLVFAVSAEKWVAGRAGFGKMARAQMGQQACSPVLSFDSLLPWSMSHPGGDREESHWTTFWDRNYKHSVSPTVNPCGFNSLTPALKPCELQIG